MSEKSTLKEQKEVLNTFIGSIIRMRGDLGLFIQEFELDGLLTENQINFIDDIGIACQQYIDLVNIDAQKRKKDGKK